MPQPARVGKPLQHHHPGALRPRRAVGGPGQSGFRRDGYEIRTAAVRRAIPCITTVQGLWAAVQGIEAIDRDEVGVRSLQEHAARLRGARRGTS